MRKICFGFSCHVSTLHKHTERSNKWIQMRQMNAMKWWLLRMEVMKMNSTNCLRYVFHLHHIQWAFPEKNCTPCSGYQFLCSWPPWISSQFYHGYPGIFWFRNHSSLRDCDIQRLRCVKPWCVVSGSNL